MQTIIIFHLFSRLKAYQFMTGYEKADIGDIIKKSSHLQILFIKSFNPFYMKV